MSPNTMLISNKTAPGVIDVSFVTLILVENKYKQIEHYEEILTRELTES
jgi:hypothetical protein